jgi:hypothetical protein
MNAPPPKVCPDFIFRDQILSTPVARSLKKFVPELAICIILWHEKSPIERLDAIYRVTDKRQKLITGYRIIIVCEHWLKKKVRTRKF